jgi:hypothetical protein
VAEHFEVLVEDSAGERQLHHVSASDQLAAVAEVEKVLAPGERVLTSTPMFGASRLGMTGQRRE